LDVLKDALRNDDAASIGGWDSLSVGNTSPQRPVTDFVLVSSIGGKDLYRVVSNSGISHIELDCNNLEGFSFAKEIEHDP
jgi:hypothetical protein